MNSRILFFLIFGLLISCGGSVSGPNDPFAATKAQTSVEHYSFGSYFARDNQFNHRDGQYKSVLKLSSNIPRCSELLKKKVSTDKNLSVFANIYYVKLSKNSNRSYILTNGVQNSPTSIEDFALEKFADSLCFISSNKSIEKLVKSFIVDAVLEKVKKVSEAIDRIGAIGIGALKGGKLIASMEEKYKLTLSLSHIKSRKEKLSSIGLGVYDLVNFQKNYKHISVSKNFSRYKLQELLDVELMSYASTLNILENVYLEEGGFDERDNLFFNSSNSFADVFTPELSKKLLLINEDSSLNWINNTILDHHRVLFSDFVTAIKNREELIMKYASIPYFFETADEGHLRHGLTFENKFLENYSKCNDATRKLFCDGRLGDIDSKLVSLLEVLPHDLRAWNTFVIENEDAQCALASMVDYSASGVFGFKEQYQANLTSRDAIALANRVKSDICELK